MSTNTGPVSTTEIAALLAWARSLSEAGPAADPDQRAAYQTAKAALLARITHTTPDSTKDTP
jgi:hypothetical protein